MNTKHEPAKPLARLAITLGLAIAGLSLSACNTTEGAGRDIEATGDAIADTARDAKN